MSLFIASTQAIDYHDLEPALKIAGGTVAAGTAIAYTTLVPEVGPIIPLPAITSSAILSAMAFGLTKNIKLNPAIKIAGGTLMATCAYCYGYWANLSNNPQRETFLKRNEGTIFLGPAAISTGTLAAISFYSLLNDQHFIKALKYIFC